MPALINLCLNVYNLFLSYCPDDHIFAFCSFYNTNFKIGLVE